MDCFRRAQPRENAWDYTQAALCGLEKTRGTLVYHSTTERQKVT
ncbi:MAG: hypothetical protein ACE15F_05215 [bacterium]